MIIVEIKIVLVIKYETDQPDIEIVKKNNSDFESFYIFFFFEFLYFF